MTLYSTMTVAQINALSGMLGFPEPSDEFLSRLRAIAAPPVGRRLLADFVDAYLESVRERAGLV